MKPETACRTHVGLKRSINEDSYLDDTPRGLWIVADGMGGHDAGEVASAMVVDTLRDLPDAADLDAQVGAAVEAIQAVNRRLLDLAASPLNERTIGTTVVGLAIRDGHMRCFWAGDSRAYRLRDGMVSRLSRDHSLVQDLVDAGIIKAEESENHVNANVITRAVGVKKELAIDAVDGDAKPGDIFVLASDGMTRLIPDDELAAILSAAPVDAAADRLITLVLERGAPDNVTIAIVRLANEP